MAKRTPSSSPKRLVSRGAGPQLQADANKSEVSAKSGNPLLSPIALMALGLAGAAVAGVPRKPEAEEAARSGAGNPNELALAQDSEAAEAALNTDGPQAVLNEGMTEQLQALAERMGMEQAVQLAAVAENAGSEALASLLTAQAEGSELVAAAGSGAPMAESAASQTEGSETVAETFTDVVLAQANTAPAAESAAGASTGSGAAAAASGSSAAAGLSVGSILAGIAGLAVISGSGSGSSSGPAAPPVDTTAPTITAMSAKIGQSVITLTYNEALDGINKAPASAFEVNTGGAANAVTDITIDGNVVTLTLTDAIVAGDVSVRYTDPTAGNDAKAIQDSAGNDAVSFVQGKAADGYIRGAQIYIDTDKDGVADAGEALNGVVTDADGNFFLPSTAPKGAIIVVGGVNIDTGVPNTVPLKAPEGSTTVNPLTTLVQAVIENSTKAGGTAITKEAAAEQVVAALGLTLPEGASLTSYDPIAAAAANPADTNALATQKAAAQIATLITLAAATGGTETAQTNTAKAVTSNLAALITEAATSETVTPISLTSGSVVAEAIKGTTAATSETVTTAIEAATAKIATAASLDAISSSQAEALDKIRPATPTIQVDALTKDSTPEVKVLLNTTALNGSAVVAGDKVVLLKGDTPASAEVTLTSDHIAQGYVNIPTLTLAEGSSTLSAQITDKAGNTSVAATEAQRAVVEVDLTAPAAAQITASTDDTAAADKITRDNTQTLTITAETGSTVKVYDGETLLGTAAETSTAGRFSFTTAALGDGPHAFTATATDRAGNLSPSGDAYSVIVDTAAPTASSLTPTDGGQSLGLTADLVLTANQAIAKGTGNIQLYKTNASNGFDLVETIAVTSSKVTINGSSLSINPSADLIKDAAYHVKIDAGAFTDLAGNAFAGISDATTWNFTAAGANVSIGNVAGSDNTINAKELADTVTVSGTVVAQYLTGELTVQLQPSSGQAVNLSNVTYNQETGAWSATVPTNLTGTGSYTLQVNFTGSGDAQGIAGSAQKTVQIDTDAPATPQLALATNSGVPDDSITKVGTVNVTGLESGGSWEYSTNGTDWTPGTGSSVTVTGDGSKTVTVRQTDAAGNPSSTSQALAFTLDTAAPTRSSLSPADGGQSLGLTADLVLTADQAIAKGTGNIQLYKANASNGFDLVETIAVTSNQVTISGSSLSINPSADLIKDAAYHVKIDAGAFTDLAGNAFAGISDATTWNFTAAGANVSIGNVAGSDNTINATEVTGPVTLSGTVVAPVTTGTVTVELKPASGETVTLAPVTVENGQWSATLPTNLSGTRSYTLTATFTGSGDAQGIVGSAQKTVQLDTQAPAAPTLALATDSGIPEDSITNVGTVNVTGLESGGSWQYRIGNGNWTNGSSSNSFSVTGDGDKSVTVRQTDAAGNPSNTSQTLAFTLDTTPPAKGTITAITETNIGMPTTDRLTSDTTPVITFKATAGQDIVLASPGGLVNESSYMFSENNGTYTLTVDSALPDGGYALVLVDAAGNYEAPLTDGTDPATFLIDSTKPPSPVISAMRGSEGEALNLTYFSTNQSQPSFTVTAEAESLLKLGKSGVELPSGSYSVTESTPGSYTVTINAPLVEGNYGFAVFDAAGNRSDSGSASGFRIDTTPPAAPAITASSVTSGTEGLRIYKALPSLTVTGEANTRLVLGQRTAPDTEPTPVSSTLYTVTGGSNGSYTLSFSNNLPDGVYGLASIDGAGNRSDSPTALTSTAAFVIDRSAPTLSIELDTEPDTPTFVFTFSEAVTGFTQSDVLVTNGTIVSFAAAPDNKVFTVAATLNPSTTPQTFTVSANAGAAADLAGNTSAAPTTSFSRSVLMGTSGNDVLTNNSTAATHIELGGGNDTLKITSAAHATTAALDEVEGFGAGDKIDLSAILGSGGAGYTGTDAGFVELKNLALTKNPTSGRTTVTFDVHLDAATIGGSKINGAIIDLFYDPSKVINGLVSTNTYVDPDLGTMNMWSNIVSNLVGNTANGRIALAPDLTAAIFDANPIISGTGKTLGVTLVVNGLVDTFEVGIESKAEGGLTEITTVDGKTHAVDAGINKIAGASASGAGNLGIVVDTTTLGTVGDNELHVLIEKFVNRVNNVDEPMTRLRIQYDTNSATGTTAASDVIALDFIGDVTQHLTPEALTFI